MILLKAARHHLAFLNRPSRAQLEAGNYAKPKLTFQGLAVTIENPRGSIRSGVDKGGKAWASGMQHHYGYLLGTLGVDGDHFDVLIGPYATAPMAYIATTMAPPDFDKTDEQKALLGFASEDAAREAFLAMYDNAKFLGELVAMPMAEFKAKVRTTRADPRLLKGMVLLFKALVPAHDRHDASGHVVHVNQYSTRAPVATTPPVISFRSGASAPNHFRGYVMAGVPAGVSLAELGPDSATWDMVREYGRRGGKVFIDSGAFTAFTRGGKVDFDRVMGLYRQMADEAPGARFSMVMPDVVGDQVASLNLLGHYRDQVRGLIDDGQDCLVPVQKGPLSPYAAWRAAVDLLGTDQFAVSIPSNKVAFSRADLEDLFGGAAKPARVHLLGIAGNRRRLAEIAALIHQASPTTEITTDANRLRAQVGEGRALPAKREDMQKWLRDAFAHLAEDDPELRAAWAAHGDAAVSGAALSTAMAALEAASRRQADLFGTDPGEARR